MERHRPKGMVSFHYKYPQICIKTNNICRYASTLEKTLGRRDSTISENIVKRNSSNVVNDGDKGKTASNLSTDSPCDS